MFSSRDPLFFFFNDTATTEIYTLSLHDALPIYWYENTKDYLLQLRPVTHIACALPKVSTISSPKPVHFQQTEPEMSRSEEHTSELQSQSNLVCRLLLEKKKQFQAPIQLAQYPPG